VNYTGSCSLIIKSNKLDIDEISKNLKLKPSSVSRKGDVISKVVGAVQSDIWVYKIKTQDDEELSSIIGKLLEIIRPSTNYLKTIATTEDVCIRCYIQSDLAQIFFELPSKLIQQLSDLYIRLELSILSWGGAEEK